MTGGNKIPKLRKGELPRRSITEMENEKKNIKCDNQKEISVLGDIFILCKLRFPFTIRCDPIYCNDRKMNKE